MHRTNLKGVNSGSSVSCANHALLGAQIQVISFCMCVFRLWPVLQVEEEQVAIRNVYQAFMFIFIYVNYFQCTFSMCVCFFFFFSHTVRKSIARLMTVMNQTKKENLRKFYRSSKYRPKDLRPRKTRAMRRLLTPHERSLKTVKQQRRERLYPVRRYAVKA